MVSKKTVKRDALLNFTDELQAQGRLFFTPEEAQKKLGETQNAFHKASSRMIQKGKLFRPTSGFYVIVPPQYRNARSIPPEWYIDGLMKFLGEAYYVGGLSAAALHGAAHQAPQEFQVVTPKPFRTLFAPRTRIRFFTKKLLSKTPIEQVKNYAGYFNVSTPEATAIDLIRYYRWVGYLNNIATVLTELSEQLDPKKLLYAAQINGEIAHAQRLGYLLDQFGEKKPTEDLQKWISTQNPKFIVLRPGWRGETLDRNEKWRLLINEKVEPDL